MNRNQRATRNNPASKPFISGGVLSNFTGTVPNTSTAASAPVPLAAPISPSNNIQVNIQPSPIVEAPIVPIKMDQESSETDSLIDNGSINGLKRRALRQPIPKKIKRLRRNRRLRKILTPKNALMSLHELLGADKISMCNFNIMPEERGFVAVVVVNNVQYEGRGPSKMAAKNSASEKALRDIIIQRMRQSPKSQALKLTDPAQPINTDALFSEDIDVIDGDNDNDEEGEVPMLHLASFALHKLFSEWQSEGFEIPDFKIGAPSLPVETVTAEKIEQVLNSPPKRAQLPDNAESMHPTTLLCMMRPAIKYVDLGSEGQVPSILHRIGVEVDQNHFIGVAKNKKLARKFAAIDACNQLFATAFVKDEN